MDIPAGMGRVQYGKQSCGPDTGLVAKMLYLQTAACRQTNVMHYPRNREEDKEEEPLLTDQIPDPRPFWIIEKRLNVSLQATFHLLLLHPQHLKSTQHLKMYTASENVHST